MNEQGPPAGWYDDPEGDGQRWWDGQAWTDRTPGHGDDRWWKYPAIILAAIAIVVGGLLLLPEQQTVRERFDERLDAGATCAELFRIRNEADPGSSDVDAMNRRLRRIGCPSSSSTRTDR